MKIVMRKGSHRGSLHNRLGTNNQDSLLVESFGISAWEKSYHVGLVADGCTGYPAFSKTEVGANLITVYAYARIQELICSGASLDEVTRALYQACTEFIRNLTHQMIPPGIIWPYPCDLKGRNHSDSGARFRADYLASTLLGFVTDEERIVLFSAGDGIILVNDDLTIIDQDDRPEYPASSINRPGAGFTTRQYRFDDVRRIFISTDGLKHLVGVPDISDVLGSSRGSNPLVDDNEQPVSFIDAMFTWKGSAHPRGLQILLDVTYNARADLMDDDTSVVTFLKLEE
jgi:hypothetical protein